MKTEQIFHKPRISYENFLNMTEVRITGKQNIQEIYIEKSKEFLKSQQW